MTDKFDFKAALEISKGIKRKRKNSHWFEVYIDRRGEDYIKTIQAALLLADRLQSGEVSEKMFKRGREKEQQTLTCAGTIFKAMAAQLIKEVEDG